jgi:hypothetical protein
VVSPISFFIFLIEPISFSIPQINKMRTAFAIRRTKSFNWDHSILSFPYILSTLTLSEAIIICYNSSNCSIGTKIIKMPMEFFISLFVSFNSLFDISFGTSYINIDAFLKGKRSELSR